VNIPKILHAENAEDPVENKKRLGIVLAKLGPRKNGQVKATIKARKVQFPNPKSFWSLYTASKLRKLR
jgi:hypothetical protein